MNSNDQPIFTFIALRELFPECTRLVSLIREGIHAGLINNDEARAMRNYALRDIIPFEFTRRQWTPYSSGFSQSLHLVWSILIGNFMTPENIDTLIKALAPVLAIIAWAVTR